MRSSPLSTTTPQRIKLLIEQTSIKFSTLLTPSPGLHTVSLFAQLTLMLNYPLHICSAHNETTITHWTKNLAVGAEGVCPAAQRYGPLTGEWWIDIYSTQGNWRLWGFSN